MSGFFITHSARSQDQIGNVEVEVRVATRLKVLTDDCVNVFDCLNSFLVVVEVEELFSEKCLYSFLFQNLVKDAIASCFLFLHVRSEEDNCGC